MNILSARTRRALSLAALAFIAPACWARPLLLQPKRLELPPQFNLEFGAPGIDGDTVMVPASRAINADNERIAGVYIFQRDTAGNWNYAGPLLEGQSGDKLLLNGNLATVQTSGSLRVYERGVQGWSLNATIPLNQLDYVFRLDDLSLIHI